MGLEGRLAHYQILGKLGAGGMGEVYRAEDTRLGRQVALKVLPSDLAAEADRVARFRREAQLLAALQHPRIAAIHGVEEIERQRVLVLELVEGEDLSERLRRGALDVEQALEVGRQLAEALEAAHEKGIVHRDLKPANIKLATDGGIKVLDFGLAKAVGEETVEGLPIGLSMSPTVTRATQAGLIMGTAPYMSPEQARGRAVDRRTDIWAFGCVLYEALTGRRAFDGDSTTDILAAVVKEEPDWQALPPSLPPAVPLLLRRCLVKDPRRRLQAIGEARVILETGEDPGLTAALSFVLPGSGPVTPAPQRSLSQRVGLAPWLVLSLFIVMMSVALIVLVAREGDRPGRPRAPVSISGTRQLEVVVADQPLLPGPGAAVVLSRDASRIAWVAGGDGPTRLFVRNLASDLARELPGTEGAREPFFSPDGEWIGFFGAASLKKVNVTAGAALTLAPAKQARGGTWTGDGRIVYAPDLVGGLQAVDAAGGEPRPLTELAEGELSHRWPDAGADEWLVFVSRPELGDDREAVIRALPLSGGEGHVLHRGGSYPRLLGRHLLFVQEGTLFSARVDEQLERLEDPRPILEGIGTSSDGKGDAQLDSADGALVFRRPDDEIGRVRLVFGFDPSIPLR
jgi:serine/threonine-protein kinase